MGCNKGTKQPTKKSRWNSYSQERRRIPQESRRCSSRSHNGCNREGYHFTDDNSSNSNSQIQSDSKADKEKQGPVGGLCSFQGSKRGSSRSKGLRNGLEIGSVGHSVGHFRCRDETTETSCRDDSKIRLRESSGLQRQKQGPVGGQSKLLQGKTERKGYLGS